MHDNVKDTELESLIWLYVQFRNSIDELEIRKFLNKRTYKG